MKVDTRVSKLFSNDPNNLKEDLNAVKIILRTALTMHRPNDSIHFKFKGGYGIGKSLTEKGLF